MRFCLEPGCRALVDKGRCPAHRRQVDRQRVSAHDRGYGRRWERFVRDFRSRLVALDIVPACGARLAPGPSPWSLCAQQGLQIQEALDLDHDPPLEDWERKIPERVCDPSRVAFLCHRDHARKTLMERRP